MLSSASSGSLTRDSGTNVRVMCRFRPLNSKESDENGQMIISIDQDTQSVKCDSRDYPGTYSFDRIFDWTTSQETLFQEAAAPIVQDVMKGYNGTIFAYGQTGSGKTYTMMGEVHDTHLKGVTPRVVETIFSTILNSPSDLEFTVKVSFMEIYMERVRDLLEPSNDNLPVHEDRARGVYVKGLLEVFVASTEEVFKILDQGTMSRAIASTNMNDESSRSHAIFVLQVTQKNLVTGTSKVGKLYLVDLAGSEKVGKTGATGQTLEEAKKINRSLTTLGMVINSLTDGKSTHVPYRDSKLTRILSESLGGNARTTLIINCSPSSSNDSETVSTLRFGTRAKKIQNKAKINTEVSASELKKMLKTAQAELGLLQNQVVLLERELGIWRTGEIVPEEERFSFLGGNPTPSAPSTPTRSQSRQGTGMAGGFAIPATPTRNSAPLDEDEREAFLARENELVDQLAEKERLLKEQIHLVSTLKDEIAYLQTKESSVFEENKTLQNTIRELSVQLENLQFENKESVIAVDSLRESRAELESALEAMKSQIQQLESERSQAQKQLQDQGNTGGNGVSRDQQKERLKKDIMGLVFANFDPTDSARHKEQALRDSFVKLGLMDTSRNSYGPISPTIDEESYSSTEMTSLRTRFTEKQSALDTTIKQLHSLRADFAAVLTSREDLERRLSTLENEYEQLLDRTIQEEDMHMGGGISAILEDLKKKLEVQYSLKREAVESEVEAFRREKETQARVIDEMESKLERVQHENTQLKAQLSSSQPALNMVAASLNNTSLDAGVIADLEAMRKDMGQQLAEFESMKSKLIQDLQNRCEKIVELELCLDETRDQYESAIKSNKSLVQQKKMLFLEKNLEQLTQVQKQLIDQNALLKKEVSVVDKKLAARNERIQVLEKLLQDSQSKVEAQRQNYESHISTLRDKLTDTPSSHLDSHWVQSSRIAKPLRGGGASAVAGDDQTVMTPVKSRPQSRSNDLNEFAQTLTPRRSSWYISLLRK